jgi:hypothetical protein
MTDIFSVGTCNRSNAATIQLLVLMLLMTSLVSAQSNSATATKKAGLKSIVLIEAESTRSELGEWVLLKKGNENYVEGASGNAHLEFSGNNPSKGEPGSPLEYHFEAPADGNFRFIMLSSKRLEGVRGDLCNDVWVKMAGDFETATSLGLNELRGYIKFFQEGSVKTPEKSWHWSYRAEKGKKEFFNLAYQLKKGQNYKITVAGRSQRFSFDYLVLYDESKFTLDEAKATLLAVASK